MTHRLLTPPNLLSELRFAIAPVLLWSAWTGRATAFLVLVGVSFLSDVLDGHLARRLGQTSAFGARLDTAADAVSYVTIPLCGWWLWPTRVQPEAPYLLVLAVSYASPFAFAYLRYGRPLGGHRTWGGRLSACLLAAAALVLIAGGPPAAFRVAVAVVVLADLEEIAITALLPRERADVPTLWHALRDR